MLLTKQKTDLQSRHSHLQGRLGLHDMVVHGNIDTVHLGGKEMQKHWRLLNPCLGACFGTSFIKQIMAKYVV